ncbi:MAG TPA: glycosyltransferase family 1 protein [Gammaproteobacteria bacterium]|nr:glycosyltransferase family 1 protein [Gammaproteobacteria bacterium]
MRIGIMLRHIHQHGGGVKVYTQNLLDHLFRLAPEHEFELLYQQADGGGRRYRELPNVRTSCLPIPTRFLWDQLGARFLSKRLGLDLLFNPKYSLPIYSSVPGVFVCHGLDWYVMPWGSKLADRVSHKYLMPRYVESAAGIIAVSETTRQHMFEYWKVEPERVEVIHHGIGEQFFRPVGEALRARVRRDYRLPRSYLLYVGQIYAAKNFARLLRAYAAVGPRHDVHLVVAGGNAEVPIAEQALIEKLGIGRWVVPCGWIDHDLLPAFYAEARALLLPSLYESAALPLVEAMAAGCPVVTSNRYGTREIAQDAGLLVDPDSVDSIAEGIERALTDDALCTTLVANGRRRSQLFSWKRCALETLAFLEQVHAHGLYGGLQLR